jgi:ClpP class serine protease
VAEVLLKRLSKEKAVQLAAILSDGRWTHDFPITIEGARPLGLPVATNMPRTVYQLMDLYPQAATGRPSVLYVPLRRAAGDQGETPKSSPASPNS